MFNTENGKKFAIEAPFWGLGATYAVHLRLTGKLIGDFLLVIVELVSLHAFVLSQYTLLTNRQMDTQTESGSNTMRLLRSRTVTVALRGWSNITQMKSKVAAGRHLEKWTTS